MSGTEPELLLAEARADFQIRRRVLEFGGRQISFWSPADPEAILDDETLLRSHDQLDWQPYWAQAWDAGLGLATWLAERPLDGRSVLDLGCGLGLTSAVLLAGGARVVCGDNAPPALLFTRINTWPWRSRARVQLIDWHRTRLDETFEWIVGSDILYDRREVRPLDRFFRKHLEPRGQVILGDPTRPMTVEFLEQFRSLGWHQQTGTLSLSAVQQPIRIVTMSREKSSSRQGPPRPVS